MTKLQVFRRYSFIQVAAGVLAVSSYLSGCGDDESSSGGKGKGGSSGSAGAVTGGTAGSGTGGNAGSSTGGSGGMTGGTGGSTMAGSGGSMAGNAGSTMGGSAGDMGMGGEGGIGMGGEGGIGVGGEGGSTDAMCTTGNLSFTQTTSTPNQAHDHLPVMGANRTTFLDMVNSGAPLTFMMPMDGTNPHTHTLTFTGAQLTTLRNGGTIAMITSSMGGPAGNMHTHTYSIECAP